MVSILLIEKPKFEMASEDIAVGCYAVGWDDLDICKVVRKVPPCRLYS